LTLHVPNKPAVLTHDLKSIDGWGVAELVKFIFSQKSTGHQIADMRQ